MFCKVNTNEPMLANPGICIPAPPEPAPKKTVEKDEKIGPSSSPDFLPIAAVLRYALTFCVTFYLLRFTFRFYAPHGTHIKLGLFVRPLSC